MVLAHTKTMFSKLTRHYVRDIKADKIILGEWISDSVLLVMPGGADLPYCHKLDGVGNNQIKKYVAGGGSYLGICAGAYYACRNVEFDMGGRLQVYGERHWRLLIAWRTVQFTSFIIICFVQLVLKKLF